MAIIDAAEQGPAGRPGVRVALTVALTVTMVATVALNALAGVGTGPFSRPTGNVSDLYSTCFTPAGFTFSIWSIIYIFLVYIVIYNITLLFRKQSANGEPMWRLGGALPASFLLAFTINLLLNIGWLFTWDGLLLTGSAIVLLLIALTNVIAEAISAYWFSKVAPILLAESRADFWLGLVAVNGYALYVTWTCLAACLNLAIFLIHEVSLDATAVCISMLSVIPCAMVGFALLEALVFIRTLNILVTPYFVYLWASFGIYSKNKDNDSEAIFGLLIANLVVAAILCAVRVVTVGVRNRSNKVYSA